MHVRYLRVIALEELGLEVVPASIAELKCLKLLDLMKNPIKVLPSCIMRLYNLQSLILYKCTPLSNLPEGLSNLVNLRHLGLSFYISPVQGTIQQLTSLQILPPLQLSEGGFKISELDCLPNIRGKLQIKGLELIKRKAEAKMANLSVKTRVEELQLTWDDDKENDDYCNIHEDVLNELRPNPMLKVLSIQGYAGDKFPSWMTRMEVSQEPKHVTLCNLQKIELVGCRRCSQLPTLGDLPNLKSLYISNMDNLTHITSDFYCGVDLLMGNKIEATNSSSSSSVKSKCYFPRLKEFQLYNLPNLTEWFEPGRETGIWIGFQSLEVLLIENCPKLKIIPDKFPSLEQLTMKNINSDDPLSEILSNKSSLMSLKVLYISKIEELTHLPEALTKYCTSLHTLIIFECQMLTCLPECLSKLLSLEVLKINMCPGMVSLPNLSGLELLRELEISYNSGLTSAPEGMQSCYSLDKLWFSDCPKLETLPDLTGLTGLSNLCVTSMTKMISGVPDWMYNLPNLRNLHIGNYKELKEFPDFSCLSKITSLKALHLYGWETMENQSLPAQLKNFKALETLSIHYFKNLECLPNWIQNLSSLQILYLVGYLKLKELASEEAMNGLTKLEYLEIENCPLLKENIKPNGIEHHKVAPRVEVKIIN